MFGSAKKASKVRFTVKIRLDYFMYVFSLRQGAIIIAIHQFALSWFVLILLLVALLHAREAMTSLETDMNDEVELYGTTYGEGFLQAEINTNNLKKFQRAQHLASVSLMRLYIATILTSIYTVCCLLLLYGAVKSKSSYLWPWIIAACFANTLIITAVVIGEEHRPIVDMFGGHIAYHCISTLLIAGFTYVIFAVLSFALEINWRRNLSKWRQAGEESGKQLKKNWRRNVAHWRRANEEGGEPLVLLDCAAHSSLLSAAQLNKLSQDTKSQFV